MQARALTIPVIVVAKPCTQSVALPLVRGVWKLWRLYGARARDDLRDAFVTRGADRLTVQYTPAGLRLDLTPRSISFTDEVLDVSLKVAPRS
jgi:hypothetical protein